MKFPKTLLLILLAISIYGCAEIFNGTVLPNQCQKCELINANNGRVLFTVEGCGSENTDLEDQCQSKAWEISRGENLCDFEIQCDSWRKDKEEEKE